MIRKLSILLFSVSFCLFAGCTNDTDKPTKGTGELAFKVSGLDLQIQTKSGDNDIPVKIEDLSVVIENPDGSEVKSYPSANDFPESLRLGVGRYKIKAYCGSGDASGFGSYFVYGEEDFEILHNQSTSVSMTCSLSNVKVSVSYDESMDRMYKNYYVDVWEAKTPEKTVRFEKDETRPAFIPAGIAHIKVYTVDEAGITRASTPDPIETDPKTHLQLSVSRKEGSGTVDLSITLVTDTDNKDINVELPSFLLPDDAPEMTFSGFGEGATTLSITEGMTPAELGVTIKSPGKLYSCEIIPSQTLIDKGWPESFDLVKAISDPQLAETVKGLGFNYPTNIEALKLANIDFKDVVGKLVSDGGQPGEYFFTIQSKDRHGQATDKVQCSFTIAPPEFGIRQIPAGDAWATRVFVEADIVKANTELFRIQANDGNGWVTCNVKNAVPVTGGLRYEINGLPADKGLSIRIKYNDHYSDVAAARTEASTQVPNSDFETYCEYKWNSGNDINQYFWYGSAGASDKWWSTRNPASASQLTGHFIDGKNIYTRNNGSTPVANGDNGSAVQLLTTAWGRGNTSTVSGGGTKYNVTAAILFIGDYNYVLKETGNTISVGSGIMTSETITQGRPFVSRPAKFQFQYRFEPLNSGERFVAYAVVQNRESGDAVELGRAEVPASVARTGTGSMADISLDFVYNDSYRHLKATHICVFFASSDKMAWQQGEDRPATTNSGAGFSLHYGSKLTVDRLRLGYEF